MRWFFVVLLCATHSAAHLAGVRVDRDTSTWRDAYNRTLLWRGTNFVQKEPPYYPVIADADITVMQQMGFNVARVGVMMPGLFPTGPTPNAAYLAATKAVVDRLWAAGVAVIIDLHQDVLSPQLCGEGSPPWMLNVSSLGSLAFPEPLEAHGVPADPATGSFPNKSCAAAGPLKFIGWSEFYMTDACGKAFEQMYGGDGTMAPGVAPLSYMFDTYWHVVAAFFRGHPGVLAYELLNEPWMGDVLTTPSLLLEAGAAEKLSVGPFMERMHGAVRQSDPDTPVLYSPAELNNRLMRRVGYEEGFLPGEPMAFHVYCLTGTDGDGPTTPLAKELCHFNDGFQLTQRTDDLRRLRTAGIVTEFGAVSASATGLAEVNFVLDHFDAAQPPLSWAFWAGLPSNATYRAVLSRPYARAVSGETIHSHFDVTNRTYELSFIGGNIAATEIVISDLVYHDGAPTFSFAPLGCCIVDITPSSNVASVRVITPLPTGHAQVTITVRPGTSA